MRSGRMSCRVASSAPITITPSADRMSWAGSERGRMMGTAQATWRAMASATSATTSSASRTRATSAAATVTPQLRAIAA